MKVGDEATKLLSKIRDSLPTTGTGWRYILGKMNSAANASLPHLKKAGRLAEKGADASIPHLKKAGRLAEEAVNACLPHLKKAASLAEQGVNASLPHLKKIGGMAEQGVKSAAAFTEDGVRASLPYVRTTLDYSVEKAKQHPYMFGSLASIILFWPLTAAVKAAPYALFQRFEGFERKIRELELNHSFLNI